MGIGNLKLSIKKGRRPIHPIAIFKSLTLRGAVENLWGPQQAALDAWHQMRTGSDTVVRMNTGGGKTLVGLIIAQSLVNETDGHVLYVCATNQLVQQTIEKAHESGLVAASRYEQKWSDKGSFDSGELFCITNYASLFTGFSVLRSMNIVAVVFDDAHVAEHAIRSQFTLEIPGDSPLFKQVTNIYRQYFTRSSQSSVFEDAAHGKWDALVFVPMFVARRHAQQLRSLLLESDIEKDASNKYPWEHLKNNIPLCCIFISGKSIQITPSVVPIHTTPYFNSGVRRIYLTATMPTQTSFVRTFGIPQPRVIVPEGKSGDAQRLFVFAPGKDDDAQKESTLKIIADRKACIISPSKTSANEWVPPAKLYKSKSGHAEIQRFAASHKPELLALVGRYDGVDFPGNACKILVLDRLPRGEDHFDRFMDRSMQIGTLRSSHTAVKVTQAIGRIFRSNTDHGVVVLRGVDLHSWLLSPRNRALLPELLQKQLQLGRALQEEVEADKTDYPELVSAILNGGAGWDKLYKSYIDEFTIKQPGADADWYCSVMTDERQAYAELWDGQYVSGAVKFREAASAASDHDERLCAWYLHWAGLAYEVGGMPHEAIPCFLRAANIRSELGRPPHESYKDLKSDQDVQPSWQAKSIAALYKAKTKVVQQMHSRIDSDLIYGKEHTKRAEEALKSLGTLLGLASSRPDKAGDTGPDVLWIGQGVPYGAFFELKTGKDEEGEYSKSEIKDCNDHQVWLDKRYPNKQFLEVMVGRELGVSSKANPSQQLRLITLEALRELADRLKSLDTIVSSGQADERTIEIWLQQFGLVWAYCLDALPNKLVIDLQAPVDAGEDVA
jgi:hypothetical protein